MSVSLISGYFERELEKLGYGLTNAFFSLNHCQGDGMAFYGNPELDDLADRLMNGHAKAAVKRAIEKGFSLKIVEVPGLSNHYSHYNTMSVDDTTGYADELTPFEERSWEEFLEAVAEDVVEISHRLEREGYALIDAGLYEEEVAREYKTKRFAVRIVLTPDEDFNIADWADECLDEDYKDLIAKKVRYFSMRVEVIARETGLTLGTQYFGGTTYSSKKLKDLGYDYVRQNVSEAIEEAREALESMCLKAA